MHDIESLREIRALEYFLFGGVPAQMEPMYAAGAYRFHGAIRHTRAASDTGKTTNLEHNGKVIAVAKVNLTTHEITVTAPEK